MAARNRGVCGNARLRRRVTVLPGIAAAALIAAGSPIVAGPPATSLASRAAIPAVMPAPVRGADEAGARKTAEAKAVAIVTPSVMYVTATWKGYVWIPANSSGVKTGWTGPLTAYTTCSGFAASPTGYIVSAGSCVDGRSMTAGGKSALITAALARLAPAASAGKLAGLARDVRTNGRVAGGMGGGPLQRTVIVNRPFSAAVMTLTGGMRAQVISYLPLESGDVSLLKVTAITPLPVLEVAAQPPALGTEVVSAGYSGTTTAVANPAAEPSIKTGRSGPAQSIDGVPFTEITARNSAAMSGGPTIGLTGQVLGTVSLGPAAQGQFFNFMTGFRFMTRPGVISALLTRYGVPNQLSPADLAYRAALDEYFTGHYHEAVTQFDKVIEVDPSQARAQDLRRSAIANYPKESSTPVILWAGIGAALVIIAVAGALALTRHRRSAAGPQPREAAGTPGAPGPARPRG